MLAFPTMSEQLELRPFLTPQEKGEIDKLIQTKIPPFNWWLPAVTPAFRWDWPYLRYIQACLDQVTTGEIKRLMIFVPPRHGKSEMATIRYPIWRLEREPDLRIIIGAYNQILANKFSRKARRIATQRPITMSRDRVAVEDWETAKGGGVRAVGVGGGITGQGGNLIVIDDPVKNREEAESEAYRERCWEWYTDDLYTRLEPNGAIILIQTRWHEDDLAGKILASEDGPNWTVVSLPALAEENDPLGRQLGEALCPERFDLPALGEIKTVLGSYSFNALYQQRPSSLEGGVFKRHWWQFYTERPPRLDLVVQSWDMAFKDTKGSDYVAGQVWGVKGANRYLLDQFWDRLDFVATRQAVQRLSAKWEQALIKLVEDKANGPAVIASLRNKVPGLIPIEPQGSKYARAVAVSPFMEAGNVFLPSPSIAPWVDGFIEECAGFPNAAHDDQVDAMSQALNYLRYHGGAALRADSDVRALEQSSDDREEDRQSLEFGRGSDLAPWAPSRWSGIQKGHRR